MLAFIRVIVLLAYFIGLNTLLFIIYLTRPFHRNNVYLGGKFYSTMSKIVGLKLKMRVSDKVDPNKSYVFIANHQNSYDLITICKAAQPGVVTVGKKSLKWIPIFGLIYWLSANIMIDRKDKNKARDSLSLMEDQMNEKDLSVWFFPEGTRSNGRGLLPFKTGAFRLALATKKMIVPVCASDLHNKIDLNRWDNGTLVIEVGDPVEIDMQANAKDLAEHFHARIKTQFERLNQEAAELSQQG